MQLFNSLVVGCQQLLLVFFAQPPFFLTDIGLPGLLFLVGVLVDIVVGFTLIIVHLAVIYPIKRQAKRKGVAITSSPPSAQVEGGLVGGLICMLCLIPIALVVSLAMLGFQSFWALLVLVLWILGVFCAFVIPALMIYMLVVDVPWYRLQLSSALAAKPPQAKTTGLTQEVPSTCSVCGRPIPPNAQFCAGCGAGAETAKSPR